MDASSKDASIPIPVVVVLYDFHYTSKDSREISVRKGEKLFLIEKTNKDWWQVVRNSERRSFYVPAQYVEELKKDRPRHENVGPSSAFTYDDTVEYENLNSLILKNKQDDLPSLSNVTKTSKDSIKRSEMDVNKAQDINKEKPVPKTRTKVLARKNSYENADVVKSSKPELKSSLSQGVDNDKGDKRNDKLKYGDKITQDLSLSLPKNSDQLNLQSDGRTCTNRFDNAAYSNAGKTKINVTAKGKVKSSEARGKIDVDPGKNRMKNSYNLKVKPSNSFDYHQVSASKLEKNKSVPLLKNEKTKLSKNLSKSLEKLAEEIKFEPKRKEETERRQSMEHYSKAKPLKMQKDNLRNKKGRADDASVILDENKSAQQRSSVFSRFRRSLHHSSSFKSRNQKKFGKSSKEVCELSLSWEGGLDKIDEREEKPQSTSGGLQRSQTFMVADRSPMTFRQNNKIFSVKNRLDVAYHSQRLPPEEKVTLSTFKPKTIIHPVEKYQAKSTSPVLKEIDIEPIKKEEQETNLEQAQDGKNKKSVYENVAVAVSDTNSQVLGKGNLVFYNETYSNSEPEDNLEEKSLTSGTVEPVVDKSLKSQSSVDSNITLSEGTELSESDDNGSLDLDSDKRMESSSQQMNKRRTSLVRSKRVETSKARTVTARPPPTPTPEERPMKDLGDGWGAYCSKDGRSYYYNENTGEKNWKPPRRKIAGQEKRLDGSRESVYSDISSSLTRSNTSSPLNDRCNLSNQSLNRSNASLNSRSTYFENSSGFDRSKSGSVYRSKEESPDDLNRSSYNSSPVTGQSRSSSYSLNKSSRDSLNRFSPVENIPSEDEGLELNDHVYQEDPNEKRRKQKLKLFVECKRKSDESFKGGENVISEEAKEEAHSPKVPIPEGWQECYDDNLKQLCYVHNGTKQKWYSSCDTEGRVYFFEENSNESSWALPDLTPEDTREGFNFNIQRSATESAISKTNESSAKLRHIKNGDKSSGRVSSSTRSSKTQSMVIEPKLDFSSKDDNKTFSMPRDLSKIYGEIIRTGMLNKTKISENGKKLRKNWTPAFVVLSENYLFFFKDVKSFQNMKNVINPNSNHMCLSLKGAVIERGEKISSRKNVYKISCSDNTEVLVQTDKTSEADDWCKDISLVIQKLPQEPVNTSSSSSIDPNSPSKVGRTKSLKVKSKDTGSMEDLSASPEERQNKIKAKLKKFFNRRPTVDSLKKKGIYKDEPVFGCSLEQITKNRKPRVPIFVQECIKYIESKEENMKTDGLYRASGNLSQVQKIRLEVDQNNLSIMKDEEDVHVLTGSLKLFFRELKEPLIPFKQLETALHATDKPSKKEKIKDFQKLVKSLPEPNYDTLKFLLQHLLKVKEYQEFNRMNISNLAIVFGPTLMWPEQESANMALELMQQNVVIECLLKEFHEIFIH